MLVKKFHLAAAHLAAFLLLLGVLATAAPAKTYRTLGDFYAENGDQAVIDWANGDTGGHFTDTNKAGDPLRLNALTGGFSQGHLYELASRYGFPVLVPAWGDPHGDAEGGQSRYLGYTCSGEDFTNPAFRHDAWAGGDLENRNWVRCPWGDEEIVNSYGVERTDYDNDPKLRASMQRGMAFYYGDVLGGREKYPDFWNRLHEYVHVLAPPSDVTWGLGRMWHRDSGGNLWYISIPLAPGMLVEKQKISVTLAPPEKEARPGETAEFTGTVLLVEGPKVSRKGPGGAVLPDFVDYDEWPVGAFLWHQAGSEQGPVDFAPVGDAPPPVSGRWLPLKEGVPASYALRVTAQQVNSEVVLKAIPTVWGANEQPLVSPYAFMTGDKKGVDWDEGRARVLVSAVNLKVTAITLTPNPGQEGDLTSGTITVVNESPQAFAGVATRWVVRHSDGSTVAEGVITADYAPNEVKQLPFSFTPPRGGQHSVAAMVNPDGSNPPNEANFLNGDWPGDNRKEVPYWVDFLAPPEPTPGDRRLTLQAYSKEGYNINGEWEPSVARDPFEAKWTDDVHAVLEVDPPELPEIPGAFRGPWLDWYRIDWATLTYPKVSPDFCFGNPVPPEGTVAVNMGCGGHTAECWFEENWALDGFGIYNMMTGEDMATEPKEYPITVKFKVDYHYTYTVLVCSDDGCTEIEIPVSDSYTDTATAYLLVTGAGMVPY